MVTFSESKRHGKPFTSFNEKLTWASIVPLKNKETVRQRTNTSEYNNNNIMAYYTSFNWRRSCCSKSLFRHERVFVVHAREKVLRGSARSFDSVHPEHWLSPPTKQSCRAVSSSYRVDAVPAKRSHTYLACDKREFIAATCFWPVPAPGKCRKIRVPSIDLQAKCCRKKLCTCCFKNIIVVIAFIGAIYCGSFVRNMTSRVRGKIYASIVTKEEKRF